MYLLPPIGALLCWLTRNIVAQYQIGTITEAGATISEPIMLETSWGFAEGIRGYGAQTA